MCFFRVFLCVFWCLEERKNVERSWAEGPISRKKKCLSFCFEGCLGLFIALGTNFEVTALGGLLALKCL